MAYACAAVQYVLLFLVLVVNSDRFQILWSYTAHSYVLLIYIVLWCLKLFV